jgi:hypothetical protein
MAQLTARVVPDASYVFSMTEFLLDESAWPATLTRDHRERLRAVRDGLRSTPELLGLAAGGSFIAGEMDAYSDLDLVVVAAPSAWPGVLDARTALAARLGPLLAAFTGEHVGEPRLLICLYGPPLIHVDLKFVPLDALAQRVEDPVLLWDRAGDVRRRLDATPARYPQPDPQWIEDRFWIWVHYAAAKLARGELFETLNMIAYLRDRVLGPLALLEAAARPNGLRRIETLAPRRIPALRATLAGLDPADVGRALEAAIACYRELRAALAPPGLVRSAAEQPAVTFLGEVAERIR